jgi:hypothetical protein
VLARRRRADVFQRERRRPSAANSATPEATNSSLSQIWRMCDAAAGAASSSCTKRGRSSFRKSRMVAATLQKTRVVAMVIFFVRFVRS